MNRTLYSSNRNITIPMALYDFIVLWYFFLSGSIVLRPIASFVWIALAISGFFVFEIRKVYIHKYLSLCILMIISIAISIINSVDINVSAKYVSSILLYMVIAYQITYSIRNVEFIFSASRPFLLFLLVVTIVQKHSSNTYLSYFYPFLPQQYRRDVLMFIQNNSCNGFFNQTSSNALMLSLGVGVFLFYYKLHKEKQSKSIYFDFAMIILFFYGILLTNRRGTTVVVIIMLAYILYSSGAKLRYKVLLTGIVLLIVLYVEYINLNVFAGIISKFYSTQLAGDVLDGRAQIWNTSIELVRNSPVMGYGIDSFSSGKFEISNVHNSYIQSLLEVGVLGWFLFYLPFVYGLIRTVSIYRGINSGVNKLNYDFCRRLSPFISIGLYWQLFCFSTGLFEAFFSSEASIFSLFIVQMVCVNISIYGNIADTNYNKEYI